MTEAFGVVRASRQAAGLFSRVDAEIEAKPEVEEVAITEGTVDSLRRVQDKIRQLKELEDDLKRRVIEELGGVGVGVSSDGRALVKYTRVDQTRLDTKRMRAEVDESLIAQYTVTSPTYRLTVVREASE